MFSRVGKTIISLLNTCQKNHGNRKCEDTQSLTCVCENLMVHAGAQAHIITYFAPPMSSINYHGKTHHDILKCIEKTHYAKFSCVHLI